MAMLITSTAALAAAGAPDESLVDAFKQLAKAGHSVYILSNHSAPAWVNTFNGSGVEFRKEVGRQTGKALIELAQANHFKASDVIVLGTSPDDMRMAKNAGAIFLCGEWSVDASVKNVGLAIKDAKALKEVVEILDTWKGHWWYESNEANYSVRAVADLSSFYASDEQVDFSKWLTSTAKQGGVGLVPVAAVTARSLLHDRANEAEAQMWCLYPGSSSKNDDSEVLSGFTHGLRTMLGKAHYAKRGAPLLIRHKASTKRSKAGSTIDREDPTEQIQSLHLNPAYQSSLRGKNIFLIDDCTTHGVSLGVAAAFLRAGGANSVCGIAIGKFGNKLKYYDIELASSPFKPVSEFSFKMNPMKGKTNASAQQDLRILLA